jgi:4-diphosphocytidyl-2-C-methyl-D-erythritol kinase
MLHHEKFLAPAKINLFLEVLSRRKDGFHEIETVMQAVNIYDQLVFSTGGTNINVESDCTSLKEAKENLVYKAIVQTLTYTGLNFGVSVSIKKEIPIGAGLGGASSDAATTIKALNKLFKLGMNKNDMCKIAKECGSDVSFFLGSACAICRGRGEEISPIDSQKVLYFVLVYPEEPLLTQEVYEKLDISLTKKRRNVNMFIKYLKDGNLELIGKSLFNRLEESAFKLKPKLGYIKETFTGLGFLGVCMSGSGSSVYGLAFDKKEAMEKAKMLKKLGLGRVFTLQSIEGDF